MKLAIMQPYFFPYIGYFQLINAVDKFIFYDDVNYIKGGWINRNQILVSGKPHFIHLLMIGASSNKLINEVGINSKGNKNLLKTLKQNYGKAPYFNRVSELLETYFNRINEENSIPLSVAAGLSVSLTCEILNIKTSIEYSSVTYQDTRVLNKADRLIGISKRNESDTYINAVGGKELYSKEYFKSKGIDLKFIKNKIRRYKQFNVDFIPDLSIIDIMMFNSLEEIREMLDDYELT